MSDEKKVEVIYELVQDPQEAPDKTLIFIQGEKGEPGQQGFDGTPGLLGEQGQQGPQGDKGDKGDKGDTGDRGLRGMPGEKGDIGPEGKPGAQGESGVKGDRGDKGDIGPAGKDGSIPVEEITAKIKDVVARLPIPRSGGGGGGGGFYSKFKPASAGSGGQDGLVPAPAAGDQNKVLRGDGTWAVDASGTGDVVGPASATDNAVVRYDGVTGKLVQSTGVIIDDSDRLGIGAAPSWPIDVTKTTTATGAVAYGARLQQTLTAAANNDALTALYANPTFADGAFTGVTHFLAKLAEAGVDRFTVTDDGKTVINAPSGYTGPLIDAQVNGSSKFNVSQAGTVFMPRMASNEILMTLLANYYQYLTTRGFLIYDSDTDGFIQSAGGRPSALPSVLFTQVDSITVTAATLTTILGTAPTHTGYTSAQQKTLPANFFKAGKTIEINMAGYTSSITAATERWVVKIGSTTILDSGAVAMAGTAQSNTRFNLRAVITCRTTGAGGTLFAQGHTQYDNDDAAGSTVTIPMINTATTAFDTTASGEIDVQLAYGATNAGNTTTSTNCDITVKN